MVTPAIEQWLADLRRDFDGGDQERFVKRACGWKTSADAAALLYLAVQELKAIRESLQKGAKSKRS